MKSEEARSRFPVLERLAYLNAGTFGPLARDTIEATEARLRADRDGGRGGHAYFEGLLALRERVRQSLAATIGVPAPKLALTSSTTDGCNIVLAGLDLGPGDEIVTTDTEHFGLLGPLHASGATVRVARVRDVPSVDALDAILAETGPLTRLVALSHVTWTTGHVLPVAELKARLQVPVLVDGAQSAGATLVDATSFDFYTVSGQKWLCGPDSTGALYVADPERLRVARPSYFAQTSYEPGGRFEPTEGAPRFDSGWIPVPSLAGLEAALKDLPGDRFEQARAMAKRCRERLARHFEIVTEPDQATLVSFRAEGDTAELVSRLYDLGVVIRDLRSLGWLRVSCGYWTSDEDIDRLEAALLSSTSQRPAFPDSNADGRASEAPTS